MQMIKNINKIFEPIKTVELNYVSGDFFPHVEIREGIVCYDEEVDPSCLLHEIGHLALLPSYIRCQVDGNVEAIDYEEKDEIYFTGNENHIIIWQYFVSKQLNFPSEYSLLENSDIDFVKSHFIKKSYKIFENLNMGFDLKTKTFKNIVGKE